MKELVEQYEEASISDVMDAMSAETDKKRKTALLSIMRNKISKQERDLRLELKDADEDSKEEKRAMKKTQTALFDSRKKYLESYRDLNSIMNSKSMLKHLADFSTKVEAFKVASTDYFEKLDQHTANLAAVKRKSAGNG